MDAWVARSYDRYGARYLIGAVLGSAAVAMFFCVPLLAAFPAHYLGLSGGEYVVAVLVADAATVAGTLSAAAIYRRPLRPLFVWSSGAREGAIAAEAPTWAFTVPRRFVLATAAIALTIGLPAEVAAITVPSHDTDALGLIEISIGTLAAFSIVALMFYALIELLLRPVRASLPRSGRSASVSTGLPATLYLIPLSLIFISCTGLSFLTTERTPGEHELMAVYAAALAMTAISAFVLIPLQYGALLSPIRDLIAGNRAVGGGDLEASVPVTTTDELGELASSFNEMVEGLRERETLRGQNTELVDELRASRARIVAAADASRQSVERDLHDGAQQHLILLELKLGLVEKAIEGDAIAGTRLEDAKADLQRALSELRDLAHGIYPSVLTSDGLPGALEDAAAHAAIPASVESNGAGRYPPELEAAVYFCCLEALQNAAKHAGQGAEATVSLSEHDGGFRFEVADDGPGFDPASATGSSGLQNMSDRIGALGGELRIESAPGEGSRVIGQVPLGDA